MIRWFARVAVTLTRHKSGAIASGTFRSSQRLTPVDDELLMRRPEPLALPFAVLGTVTSLFVFDLEDSLHYMVDVLCIPGASALWKTGTPDWDVRAVVAFVAFVAFALAGKWTTHKIRDGGRPLSAAVMGCVAATQFPAALVGVVSMGAMWGPAMFAGFVAACVAAPCAMLMAKHVDSAQRSRPLSVLLSAHRRAIWLNVSVYSIVLAALYANPMFDPLWEAEYSTARIARMVVIGATLIGAVTGCLALMSLVKLRRLRRRCQTSDLPIVDDSHAHIFDMGTGNQVERDIAGGGAGAYRSRPETRTKLIGDVGRASRSLRWSLGLASAVVTTGAVVLVCELGPYEVDSRMKSPLCESDDA